MKGNKTNDPKTNVKLMYWTLTRSIVAPNTKALVCRDDPAGNLTPKESESVNACLAHPFQSHVMAPTSTPPVLEILNQETKTNVFKFFWFNFDVYLTCISQTAVLLIWHLILTGYSVSEQQTQQGPLTSKSFCSLLSHISRWGKKQVGYCIAFPRYLSPSP